MGRNIFLSFAACLRYRRAVASSVGPQYRLDLAVKSGVSGGNDYRPSQFNHVSSKFNSRPLHSDS